MHITQTTFTARYVCLLLLFFHLSPYVHTTWRKINFHHFLFSFCCFPSWTSFSGWYITFCKYNVTMTTYSLRRRHSRKKSCDGWSCWWINSSKKEEFQFIQNQGWKNPDNNSNEILFFTAAVHLSELISPLSSRCRTNAERKENYFAMLSFCLGQRRQLLIRHLDHVPYFE